MQVNPFDIFYRLLSEIKFASLRISVVIDSDDYSDNTFIGNAVRGALKTQFLQKYCKFNEKYTNCNNCDETEICPAFFYIASNKEKNFFIRIPYNFSDTSTTNIKEFYVTLFGVEVINEYEIFLENLMISMSNQISKRGIKIKFIEVRDELNSEPCSLYDCDKNKMFLNYNKLSFFDLTELLNNLTYISNVNFFLETPAVIEKDNKIIPFKHIDFKLIFTFILEKLKNIWILSNNYNKHELDDNDLFYYYNKIIENFDFSDVQYELLQNKFYKLKTKNQYKCSAVYFSMLFRCDNFTPYYPIFKVGEFFGIGRRTAFGFGYYRVF